MKVKIDTREKLHVITIHEQELAANMTEEIDEMLMPLLNTNVKNVAINMKDIHYLDKAAAHQLLNVHRQFYGKKATFVLCEMQAGVIKTLSDMLFLDQLNITPTESEAIDLIQMEELEREFGDISSL
ncbi:MAG: STAS domain-containing protein [Flavitalea sp.]